MEKRNKKQPANSPSNSRLLNPIVWRILLVALFIAIFLAGISLLPENFQGVKANPGTENNSAPSSSALAAQEDSVWQSSTNASLEQRAELEKLPHSYSTKALNQNALNELLRQTPMEFSEAAKSQGVILRLPMPNGELARFRIEESPIMHPDLAAQYPQIKTYKGQGIDDPTATTRFDWTPLGFHAIVLSLQGTVFIEPFSANDKTNYITYYNQDISIDDLSFNCLLPETNELQGDEPNAPQPAFSTGATLRTYRLAVAATAEFTLQYGSGNVATTLTKITTLVNQINAIFQREATITFQLIANEASIIFTDTATDGYTNGNVGALLAENAGRLNTVIGLANYDIGHVFGDITVSPGSASFSGRATLDVICSASKGSAASMMGGAVASFPHAIFTKGVTHEFAHQFSAPHSFNSLTGNCGGQRSASGAYEPGSGSTIMGYNTCGADNLQPSTDLYFHTGSLERIIAHAAAGACPVQSATGNGAPTIGALSNFTIPANTPFMLDASVSDPNGDALTFVWEEYDLGTASPPNDDSGNRPILRSFLPTSSTSRLFPRLQYILNNANVPPSTYACGGNTCLTGELLPTTTRTMNFRFTARDNRAAGGGTTNASMQVNVVSTAGPFAVTAPNTAVSWTGGTQQAVTWNVANTSAVPVSTANVKISLSTDGGNTFPTVVLASTPNDGTENITVPNTPTAMARIKVEAVGNIFFDLSNANFTIVAGSCTYILGATSQSYPAALSAGSVTVSTQAGCNWTAVSNAAFISVTSGASGTGNGTVQFNVAANATGTIRNGTMTIAGQTFTVFQGLDFLDVPPAHPFYTDIGKLAARGVTLGCGGGNYCPDQVVTREQMAAFILRALGEFTPPTPGSQRFTDVPPTNPFYNFIDRMAVLNITLGCGGGNYCPSAAVSREQMSAFLMRTKGEFSPPTPGSQRFNDVPPTNPFYNFIDRLAVLNITQGCSASPPLYCPTSGVTRAQMAAFLVRAFNL